MRDTTVSQMKGKATTASSSKGISFLSCRKEQSIPNVQDYLTAFSVYYSYLYLPRKAVLLAS